MAVTPDLSATSISFHFDGVVYGSVFNVLVHMFNIGDDLLGQ
jgi:hypothetical protein